jgi:hypothetical protein
VEWLLTCASPSKGEPAKDLAKLSQGEIRTATAYALNMLAANGTVVDQMKEVFDRPNPLPWNGFFVRPATPDNLRRVIQGLRPKRHAGHPLSRPADPRRRA